MGKRERARRKEKRGKWKDVIDAHGLWLLVRHWSAWNQIYFLHEVKDDSTWEKSMFSMPFIPHLNGSRSTQVSRLLHTSVHHAPHLCGLSTDYQRGLRMERAKRKEERRKRKVQRRHRRSWAVIVGKALKCMKSDIFFAWGKRWFCVRLYVYLHVAKYDLACG